MTRNTFIATLAFLSASLSLPAQVKPLKEDLLKLLDLIPGPCNGLKEAKMIGADPAGTAGCTTDKIMAPYLGAYQARSTERMTGGSGMSASQEALMKKMQDPAFQEEMKKMSPEQLMALSTQMQTGSLPSSGIPTPAETAMAEEFERINVDFMDFTMKHNNEWAQLQNALEEQRRAIEKARFEELKKCPTEVAGEMTITSPACCAEVEKTYDGQWQDAVVAWLPKANELGTRYRAAVKARYAEAEKRMVALGYGDKCGIQMFLDMVTSTQSEMLGSIDAVANITAQTWQTACENAIGIERPMICP